MVDEYLVADRTTPLANGARTDAIAYDTDDQSAKLRAHFVEQRQFENGRRVANAEDPFLHAYLISSGFLFHVLHQSSKRSIVGVSIPGDIIGFSAICCRSLEFDLVSAGRTVVAQLGIQRFREIVMTMPECAVQALSDSGGIQRQWIVNCQRLDAAQRIAHIYAELRHWLARTLGELKQVVRTPFSQTDLGDMCGITPIHVNRVVASLRNAGLAEIRRGDLYAADWPALETFANFHPRYLRDPQ